MTTPYIELLKAGPFDGRIDPWSEHARYFHQMHGDIIHFILQQIQDPLLEMGYVASKELTLQILGVRQPDISVHREQVDTPSNQWSYDAAAAALKVKTGAEVELLDLDRISVTDAKGTLITVLEVISPGNKIRPKAIEDYIARRNDLVYSQGVNVVEIDATRTYRRLLEHHSVATYSYHVMVYMPDDNPRLFGSLFSQPLEPFALPLRKAAITVKPQQAYQDAYRSTAIARQIEFNNDYTLEAMPFPTLVAPSEQQECLSVIDRWRVALAALRTGA
jgi:hypothetical protein